MATSSQERSGSSASGANSAPLGIYAESSSALKIQELRAERFYLQNGARELLYMRGKEQVAAGALEHPYNFHRTAKCSHIRHSADVTVHKSVEHNKAFFGGLVICGNVWTCPVCAAKVQERRRAEIAQMFDYAYDVLGKKVVMVTITFSHQRSDKLKDLMALFSDALTKFRKPRAYIKLRDKIGYVGLIRSLEITHGDNGWHPHTHEAWIVDQCVDTEWLRSELVMQWENACRKAGLWNEDVAGAFRQHSIQITDWCSTSDYLAKQDDSRNWGVDRELAKASSKHNSKDKKGLHPAGLLKDYLELSNTKDRMAAGLKWLEYAAAMRGKSQLFWTRGLKDMVGVKDRTDEELALEQDDRAIDLARLDKEQWRLVIRAQAKSKVLDAAENGGFTAIEKLIERLSLEAKRSPVIQTRELDVGEQIPSESLLLRKKSAEIAHQASGLAMTDQRAEIPLSLLALSEREVLLAPRSDDLSRLSSQRQLVRAPRQSLLE